MIVAAGAFHSPAMLMRSGIGPADHLSKLGIAVVNDRSGVGQNLRDHPGISVFSYIYPASRPARSLRRPGHVALRMSSGLPGTMASDLHISASARGGWHGVGDRLSLYMMWVNKPFSRGQVRLTSPDFAGPLDIDLGLLTDPRDVERLKMLVRYAATITKTAAMSEHAVSAFPAAFNPRIRKMSQVSAFNRWVLAFVGALLDTAPPVRQWLMRRFTTTGHILDEVLRDESLLSDFVANSVQPMWHVSGTCRMGARNDPMAVVDANGKVIGMNGLRVVDASIMPTLPRANTNIPTIMVAEKISDHIKSGL